MVSIHKSTLKLKKNDTKPKKTKNNKHCLHIKTALRISNKRHNKRSNASPNKQNIKLKHKILYNSYEQNNLQSHNKPTERQQQPEILLNKTSKTSNKPIPRKRQ